MKYRDNVPGPCTEEGAIKHVFNSVQAKIASLNAPGPEPPRAVVHVYMEHPTANPNLQDVWIKRLHMEFRMYTPAGCAVPAFITSCGSCYALDHPSGLCALNKYYEKNTDDLLNPFSHAINQKPYYPKYKLKKEYEGKPKPSGAKGNQKGSKGKGAGGRNFV